MKTSDYIISDLNFGILVFYYNIILTEIEMRAWLSYPDAGEKCINTKLIDGTKK